LVVTSYLGNCEESQGESRMIQLLEKLGAYTDVYLFRSEGWP